VKPDAGETQTKSITSLDASHHPEASDRPEIASEMGAPSPRLPQFFFNDFCLLKKIDMFPLTSDEQIRALVVLPRMSNYASRSKGSSTGT